MSGLKSTSVVPVIFATPQKKRMTAMITMRLYVPPLPKYFSAHANFPVKPTTFSRYLMRRKAPIIARIPLIMGKGEGEGEDLQESMIE